LLELSEKRLNRTIVTLAWPAILESLLQLTVYLTDSIMIGPLGTEAFAAVGQGSMLVHYITFPLWGIGTAVGAIVSRNIGRQDRVAAEQGAGQGLLLAGLSGAIFTVVGFLYGRDILLLLGTPPEVIEPCTDYLVTVLAFNTFYSVRMVGSSILRALGDTKTPMIATAAMNVFNIAANYVLIYGIGPFPRMETTGVALASGLSFVISAVMVCWKLFDHPGGFRIGLGNIVRLRRAVMGNIMRIAAPSFSEMILMRIGGFTYLWIVTGLGTVPLAAHFMTLRVESLAFMPSFGLSMAVPPIVGQALGAGQIDIVRLAVKRTIKLGFWAMNVVALVFLLFPGMFVQIFSPEPEAYALATLCVQIAALELAGVTVSMIYGGAMRGAGDTVSPMIITFMGSVVIRVPLVYILAITFGWGLAGVWAATAVDWILRAGAGYVLFKRERWTRVNV
jgi:putative MATE family efflux protein